MKHLIKGAAAVLAVLALASCDLFAVLAVPESPTGLTATQDGAYIDLVWNAASGAESYKIYAKAPGASSHTYRGVRDDTDYTFNPEGVAGTWSFMVAATNANGDSGYSNVATETIQLGPDTPNVPNVYGYSSFFYVSWTAVTGATSYELYASVNPASLGSKVYTGSNTYYYYYPGINESSEYYFSVVAVNEMGSSEASAAGKDTLYGYSYEGGTSAPVVLTTSTTPMSTAREAKVGYGTTNQFSYYKFVAPYSSTYCYIQISNVSPSSVDLDYYLYSDSAFSSPVAQNTEYGTNMTWRPNGITRGQTYYLKVKNHTNSSNVSFNLRVY